MGKVIKDGFVAVVIHPTFGGGWSTWNVDELTETLIFHPSIVNAVLEGRRGELNEEWFIANFGENYRGVWTGAREEIEVVWVKEGTVFKIEEYDGAENICELSYENTFKA